MPKRDLAVRLLHKYDRGFSQQAVDNIWKKCPKAHPEGNVAAAPTPVTEEESNEDYDSDAYSEADCTFFGHVENEHDQADRQQSREFLRRLGVHSKVRLPPDQPEAEDLLKGEGRRTGPEFGRALVAFQITRKEWMQKDDAKKAVQQ